MVITDSHLSIKIAVTEFYPGASLQLCAVHRIRKILSKFGAKKKAEVFQDLCRIYKADSYEQAKEEVKAFSEKYSTSCPKAEAILNKELEENLTFYSFPKELACKLYSTNQHECFNRTVRARLKTCAQFPDISACCRLAIS